MSLEPLLPGLRRYADDHIEPGSFLRAVLENDLERACALADPVNRYRIYDVVTFLVLEVDPECWGSPEKVRAWIGRVN